MSNPQVTTELGSSKDRRQLQEGNMFNWTIINDELHRCSGGRIDHDVPSYGRSHIGIEDKQRKDVPEWIGENGDRCRRGSPHDSGQEDGIENTRLQDLQGLSKECQGKEGPEWVKR